ncbi:hypothetical protein EC973_007220 [Apophysomyces ossiformis]|uniref:Uncharacterized protein n=1 Tax=Apophysomyces ossiformis TaxID=679940 RepID=A0A8H7BUK6_9FUNG|nr:hypothetical protein EC973_007220 [Apophysomyces ossiformis]
MFASVKADISSFGLPRHDHCALAFNGSFYIFGGQPTHSDLLMTFSTSIALPPVVRFLQIDQHMPRNSACVVTSYGQTIFPCNQTLNLQTLRWESAQALNGLYPNVTMALWNDILVVAGDITSVFDVRLPSSWVQLPIRALTPAPGVNARMAVTSRWVLHFTTTVQIPPTTNGIPLFYYNTTVHCFDPIALIWRGRLIDFAILTEQINVATISSDTLLIAPSRLSRAPLSGKETVSLPEETMWKLSVSKEEPRCNLSRIAPVSYRPVAGASMTTIFKDQLVVFYGGDYVDQDNLLFWNVTSSQFLDPPAWWLQSYRSPSSTTQQKPLSTQQTSSKNSIYVAIILGALLGMLALLVISVGCYFLYQHRRRRRRDSLATNLVQPTCVPDSEQNTFTYITNLRRGLSSMTTQSAPSAIPREETTPASEDSDTRRHSRFTEHFDMKTLLLHPEVQQKS